MIIQVSLYLYIQVYTGITKQVPFSCLCWSIGMERLMDVNQTSEIEYSGTTQICLRAFILFACLKPAVLRLTLIYRTHKHKQTPTKDWLMDLTFIQHKQTHAHTVCRHCDYSLMLAAVCSWWLNSSPAIALEILSLGCPWS